MAYPGVNSCDSLAPAPAPAAPTRTWRARIGAVVALVAAAGATACGDPTGLSANYDTLTASVTVYALNGSGPERPAAVLIASTPQAIRLSSDYAFDFSVDFDEGGAARLIPVQRVGSPVVISSGRAVGFQKSTDGFDSIVLAPTSGYDFDSDLPVSVGDVGIIESRVHPFCASVFYTYSYTIYAKFQVEALDAQARTATIKVMVDPNCGFRELVPGTPKR